MVPPTSQQLVTFLIMMGARLDLPHNYDADLDSESFDNPSDVNVSDSHDPASYVGRSLSEDDKLRILT